MWEASIARAGEMQSGSWLTLLNLIWSVSRRLKAAISRRMVMSMLGSDFDEFIFLLALGTRGGILLAWKSSSCTVLNSRVEWSTLPQFLFSLLKTMVLGGGSQESMVLRQMSSKFNSCKNCVLSGRSAMVLGRWVVTLILYTRPRIRAIPTLIGL